VVSHRGAGVDSVELLPRLHLPLGRFAPENSLAALRWAILVGADAVEIDLQTSRDGHLVLIHDEDVSRTTNGTGRVDRLTLRSLQQLRLATAQFRDDFRCEQIPTLEQALELARGRINIVVDLKWADARKVARLVRRAGMARQVLLMPPSADMARLTRLVPDMPLVARPGRSAQRLEQMLQDHAPAVVQIPQACVTPGVIATVHAAGAKVAVNGFENDISGYLTESPAAYATLLARHADIINVDRADLLLRLMGRR